MNASFSVDLLIHASLFFVVMLIFFVVYVSYSESKFVDDSLNILFAQHLTNVIKKIDDAEDNIINWDYVKQLGETLSKQRGDIEQKVKNNNRRLFIIAGSLAVVLVLGTIGAIVYFYNHPKYHVSLAKVFITIVIVLITVLGAKVIFYSYLAKHYHPINKLDIDNVFINRIQQYLAGEKIDDLVKEIRVAEEKIR